MAQERLTALRRVDAVHHQAVRLPSIGACTLWLLDLDAPLDDGAGCLSTAERQRAGRFVFAQDRHRYEHAHVGLRRILSSTVGRRPNDLVFAFGPSGKPHLASHPGCGFNLSHSEGVGLVGIVQGQDIGVDIEVLRDVPDRHAMVAQHFDEREHEALLSTRDPSAFLRAWTRKEAGLKAVGAGIGTDLRHHRTGVSCGPDDVDLDIDGVRRTVGITSFSQSGRFVASVAVVARPVGMSPA